MNIKKQDYEHLKDVVGSLMIKQFKGKDKQDQYREVISMIFEQFRGKVKPRLPFLFLLAQAGRFTVVIKRLEHWTELTVTPKQ